MALVFMLNNVLAIENIKALILVVEEPVVKYEAIFTLQIAQKIIQCHGTKFLSDYRQSF